MPVVINNVCRIIVKTMYTTPSLLRSFTFSSARAENQWWALQTYAHFLFFLSVITHSWLHQTCNEGNGTFPGTQLSNCTFLAEDVEFCQSKGKTVTISLGGADSSVGFTNESQAEGFATTIWDMFLGGDGDIRPFGSAVLDGWALVLFSYHVIGAWAILNASCPCGSVDLDIEGGLPANYDKFVDKLRTYTDNADKQCVDMLHTHFSVRCLPHVFVGILSPQLLNALSQIKT